MYCVPAGAILVGWLWLDELPPVAAVIGGVVAISGVILTNTGRAAQPPATTASTGQERDDRALAPTR